MTKETFVAGQGVRQPSLREEHKLLTRARIRRWARQCFERDGIRDVSLEQIAAEAGIGRTTLYQYYPTKPDLLFDLMEQNLRATDRVYQRLAQLSPLDRGNIAAWLGDYLAEVRDHASAVDMFHVELGKDAIVRGLMRKHWARTIAILGKRFRAFDLSGLSGDELIRRTYAAESLLDQIEQFCGVASRADYHLDAQVVIGYLAEKIAAELQQG